MNDKKELIVYRLGLLERMHTVVDDVKSAAGHYSAVQLVSPCLSNGETPHHVIIHLAVIEEYALWPRLQRIVQEEHPILGLFHDDSWMEAHYDPNQAIEEALSRYGAIRQTELDFIRLLPPSAWSRTSRHPWSGERTFQWWVERTLAYSLEHLALLSSN